MDLLQEEAQELREALSDPLEKSERHRLWLVRKRQWLMLIAPLSLCCRRELMKSLRQLPLMREIYD